MKRAVAVVVAILLALPLGGCSLLFHRDDVAEEPLRERIGDLASVVVIESAAAGMFSASVYVEVNALVESDLQSIVANANELLRGRDATLDIAFDDHNVVALDYPLDHSPEQLASEVDYWLALSAANGSPLGILVHQGPYRNIWDPDETDVVDWEALRAVPDPSTAKHSWNLDGIWAADAMPTPDVIALRDRLATIELGADETLALEYFSPGYVEVRYRSPEAGLPDPTVAASWPRMQDMVSQIAALGLPQANFVIWTDSYANAAFVHLGDCADLADEEPEWASAELLSALTSSGIEFPLGVGSGFCNDARG